MSSFEIKSDRLNALSLILKSLDESEIKPKLTQQLDRLRNLTLPVILDLSLYDNSQLSQMQKIVHIFKEVGINIIAIQHYDEQFSLLAHQLGLVFQLGIQSSQVSESANHHAQTVIMDKPVRSGQQIYAKNGDLIVTSLVSEGAEIASDGNIHVYAPVRGRVFAGVSGNFNARIFILSMQAQLVCIAGVYKIFDQKLPSSLYKQSVKICLHENKLSITAIYP